MCLAIYFALLQASAFAGDLKILTWNIQMLPDPVQLSFKKSTRSKLISDVLNKATAYDVILFEEAFRPASVKILKEALKEKYPYQFGPANYYPGRLLVNSGILIFSRHPARALTEIQFKNSTGNNKFARKGALLIEINKDGQYFQIAGTHMNSEGPEAVRKNQILEIRAMLDQFENPNIPQILAGDFNIYKKHTHETLYDFMIENTRLTDGPISGAKLNTYDCDNNDYLCNLMKDNTQAVLDYILFDFKTLLVSNVTRTVPDLRQKGWHPKHPEIEELSDHLPLELNLTYSNH